MYTLTYLVIIQLSKGLLFFFFFVRSFENKSRLYRRGVTTAERFPQGRLYKRRHMVNKQCAQPCIILIYARRTREKIRRAMSSTGGEATMRFNLRVFGDCIITSLPTDLAVRCFVKTGAICRKK